MESEIVEVYSVATGTNWFLDSGATARIPALLASYNDPRTVTIDAEGACGRWIVKWNDDASGDDYAEFYDDFGATDLATFQAAYPDDASRTLVMLYDAKTTAYLLGP